jgi:hypothetical protein
MQSNPPPKRCEAGTLTISRACCRFHARYSLFCVSISNLWPTQRPKAALSTRPKPLEYMH